MAVTTGDPAEEAGGAFDPSEDLEGLAHRLGVKFHAEARYQSAAANGRGGPAVPGVEQLAVDRVAPPARPPPRGEGGPAARPGIRVP